MDIVLENGFVLQFFEAIVNLAPIPTGIPCQIDINSTSILRWYVNDQNLTNYHVISTYFFRVILLIKKSTLFPRTFFDVISLVKKSTLFPCTFFGVISLVEKSMLFPCTFFWCNFDSRKIYVVSTYFLLCNSLVEKSTLFPRTFFDVIIWLKNPRFFHVLFST